jgi:hypothetical protein
LVTGEQHYSIGGTELITPSKEGCGPSVTTKQAAALLQSHLRNPGTGGKLIEKTPGGS